MKLSCALWVSNDQERRQTLEWRLTSGPSLFGWVREGEMGFLLGNGSRWSDDHSSFLKVHRLWLREMAWFVWRVIFPQSSYIEHLAHSMMCSLLEAIKPPYLGGRSLYGRGLETLQPSHHRMLHKKASSMRDWVLTRHWTTYLVLWYFGLLRLSKQGNQVSVNC